jgi:CheY-like chemotaxis protein
MTAYASSADRWCAPLDAGFDQHVAKPIELASLVLAISSVVRPDRPSVA